MQDQHLLLAMVLAILINGLCWISKQLRLHANEFDDKLMTLSQREYHWLIWPALAAQMFFDKAFGQFDPQKKWHSGSTIFKVLMFSLAANLACLALALYRWPEAVATPEATVQRTILTSIGVFAVFNFFGDLVSLRITRKVLTKITSGRCNFFPYIFRDVMGVILGYLITMLPVALALIWLWFSPEASTEVARNGLLGSAMVPWFLYIFVWNGESFIMSLACVIAIFTITIPTLTYLCLICFCFGTNRIYRRLSNTLPEKSSTPLDEQVGKLAAAIATVLAFLLALSELIY